MRDQFVCGLHNEAMHTKLLAEDTFTLKLVFEIAAGIEAVSKDVKTL